LAALVNSWRVTGVPLVPPELQGLALTALDGLLQLVIAELGAPAYADFTAGAPTLLLLAAAEPVPGVTYFTFGGIRPVLLNLRGWAFTPDSTIPLPHLPPWHWYTAYVPLLPVPPPGLVPFPEVLEGGDLLTNSALTRLPFACTATTTSTMPKRCGTRPSRHRSRPSWAARRSRRRWW
jgi:hypothetical protein